MHEARIDDLRSRLVDVMTRNEIIGLVVDSDHDMRIEPLNLTAHSFGQGFGIGPIRKNVEIKIFTGDRDGQPIVQQGPTEPFIHRLRP